MRVLDFELWRVKQEFTNSTVMRPNLNRRSRTERDSDVAEIFYSQNCNRITILIEYTFDF